MRLRPSIVLAGANLLTLTPVVAAERNSTEANEQILSVEEVVVTARRRAESIADVPQVINAITPDTVSKLNILNFQDLQAVVPGVSLDTSSTGITASASVRGVTFDVESSTTPTVAWYVNDAPVDPSFLFHTIYDIGQIEIQRGPQGTLRGRSAPSGAITVTTRKADLSEFGGNVRVIGTDRNQIDAQAALNVPIVADVLGVRFAGVLNDNDYDGARSVNNGSKPSQHVAGGRASLSFVPSDAFKLDLTYEHLQRSFRQFRQVTTSGSSPTPSGAIQNGPALSPEDRLAVSDGAKVAESEYDFVTVQGDYRFAGQMLSYVGSYSQTTSDVADPLDTNNMVPNVEFFQFVTDADNEQLTHELRIASEERLAGRFDYTAGVFYLREEPGAKVNQPAAFLPGAFGTPALAPNALAFNSAYVLPALFEQDIRREEESAFASLTWHATERTELTAGARYIISNVDISAPTSTGAALAALPSFVIGQLAGIPIPMGTPCSALGLPSTYPGFCDAPVPAQQLPTPETHRKDKQWVYNVSVSQHLTDDLMAYASAGTSWRPGTFSVGIQNGANDPVLNNLTLIDPEKSRSFELGFKASFLDGRGQINAAAYRQVFDDLIFRTPFINYLADPGGGQPPSVNNLYQFIVNADAEVDGVDLDASFLITSRWRVLLGASYADGRTKDEAGNEIPCNDSNFDGQPDLGTPTVASFPPGQYIALCRGEFPVSRAPKWNATLQSEYFVPVASSLEGYVRGLFTYYPENDRATPGFTADNYGLLNVFAGLRDSSGTWDIQLFAKNVTDTEEATTLDATPLSWQANQVFGNSAYFRTSLTPRREVGVAVSYSFGSR